MIQLTVLLLAFLTAILIHYLMVVQEGFVVIVDCPFDAVAYANKYPDLMKAFGTDAAKLKDHYKNFGLNEGRSPCGDQNPTCKFDGVAYLAANPDVAKAGMDPVTHYKSFGINEGRKWCTPAAPVVYTCPFDAVAYANKYPDLMKAFGTDAAKLKDHYKNFGLNEGRSPCGDQNPTCKFDGVAYLAANPDVAKAGMDPVTHYKSFGINEGRKWCKSATPAATTATAASIEGKSVKCSPTSGGIYRGENGALRPYPSPQIAATWDPNWASPMVIDCTKFGSGPAMPPNPAKAVKCSPTDSGRYANINGTRRLYPNPTIAAQYDPNWANAVVVDCSNMPEGPPMPAKVPKASLTEGQAVKCNPFSMSIYRYTNGTIRAYPSPTIAASWDPNWDKAVFADCTGIPVGPDMKDKATEMASATTATPAAAIAPVAPAALVAAMPTTATVVPTPIAPLPKPSVSFTELVTTLNSYNPSMGPPLTSSPMDLAKTGSSAGLMGASVSPDMMNQQLGGFREIVRDELSTQLKDLKLGPKDAMNATIMNRNTPTGASTGGALSDGLVQGQEFRTSSSCPYATGQPSIDMNDYVRKDSIPCWGCNLK